MEVKIGQAADYERHEPVETDRDDDLQTETIKQMMRAGYEYEEEYEGENRRWLVLRPAQVIIVKNED